MKKRSNAAIMSLFLAAAVCIGVLSACASTVFAGTIPVRATDVTTAADGNVLVTVQGTFYTQDVNVLLERINAIRKEACEEGIENPSNEGTPLTPADYTPLKWSSELEKIAQTRAAEASIYQSHTRPSGQDWVSFARGTQILSSEDLAWHQESENVIIKGINLWYGEKSDWVNHTEGAVTGHYTSMINPSYNYVALGCFKADDDPDRFYTVSGELSYRTDLTETSIGVSGRYAQVIEMKQENASGYDAYAGETEVTDKASSGTETPGTTTPGTETPGTTTPATETPGTTTPGTETPGTTTPGTDVPTAELPGAAIPDPIPLSTASVKAIKAQVCTGKALKPAVTVKIGDKTLEKDTDYTVTYKNNKKPGTAKVVISGKGDYTGSVTKSFKIAVAKASPKALKAEKRSLIISWKKAKSVNGYEVRYSTSAKFAKKATKTVKIKKASTVKYTAKKLKSGKKYYTQIRSFKKIGKKTYYSAWSKAKSAKVK